jgi:ribonuclease HI
MISSSIKILQVNLNRNQAATESALQVAIEASIDLILVQEPWIYRQEGQATYESSFSTQHPSFTQILPKNRVLRPRTLVYVSRSFKPLVSLAPNSPNDPDCQAITIVEENSKILLLNVYNEADQANQAGHTLDRVIYPIFTSIPRDTLVLGDFNTHHPNWDPLARTSQGANNLIRWFEANNLTLLNTPGQVTFFRPNTRPSVLDLTLASRSLASKAIDWQVIRNIGSDHLGILFTLQGTNNPLVDPPFELEHFNTSKADWPLFQSKLRALTSDFSREIGERIEIGLDEAEESIRILQQESSFTTTLDHFAEELTRAITSAAKASIPIRSRIAKAKPWWTSELKGLRQEMKSLQRHLQPTDQQATQAYIQARNRFFQEIKKAKREHWNQFLEKEDAKSIFKALAYTKGRNAEKLPPIQGSRGQLQDTFQGRCKALRNTLFPTPPSTTNLSWNRYTASRWNWPTLTKVELINACSAKIKGKTPGPDGITQALILKAYEAIPEVFFSLYSRLIDLGYHPRCWRQATGAVLKKPSKPDYSLPKAYRIISLLNCLGKVSERILAQRLGYLAETSAILHPTQIGGRQKKSAIDAALLLLQEVEANREQGKKTSTVFLDVKGAFDHVSKNQLLRKLRDLGLPTSLIAWTSTFVKNRQIRLSFDNQIEGFQDVDVGIPQGSPISPILFLIYIRDLFYAETVKFGSYIDDIRLTYASTSLKKNTRVLTAEIAQLYKLAEKNAIEFDLAKTELIHFTKGKQGQKQAIKLPDNTPIKPSPIVKWLGIYFDQQLRFTAHVTTKAASAKKAFFSLERLANSEQGLSPYAFRQLYLACVASIADYGSILWWKGKGGHKDKLRPLQNIGLRKILGAFRTSPITSMEIEAALPPIEVRLNSSNRQYAFRAIKLASNHPINIPTTQASQTQLGRIRNSIQGLVLTPTLEQIRHFHFPPWAKDTPFKVVISSLSKEDEAKSHNIETSLALGTNTICTYTDASSSEEAVGIGVGLVAYNYSLTNQRNQTMFQKLSNLGSNQIVYNGELEGVTQGVEYIAGIAKRGWLYKVYSDNQAGLLRLRTPSDNPGQSCQIRTILAAKLIQEKGASIVLQWVPGHKNVEGNEKADELAKRASKQASSSKETSWAMYGLRIKQVKALEWKEAVQLADKQRRRPQRAFTPSNRLKVGQGTKRILASTFYQLKLGHGYQKAFLYRIGKANDDKCLCGAKETTDHLLFSCLLWRNQRKEELMKDLQGPITSLRPYFLNTEIGIRRVIRFLEVTRVGTRKWHLDRIEREEELERAGELDLES